MKWSINRTRIPPVVIGLALLVACDQQDMYQQPKYEPLQPSAFFNDGRSARLLETDTVARGELRTNSVLYGGRYGTNFVAINALPTTKELLERGEERYNIFCAPCHDLLGNGNGMIVQRGFPRPPSLHIPRLRDAPIGYLYEVMSKGSGASPDFASQISPEDRWAIAAYIRALQFSQHALVSDAPAAQRQELEAKAP